MISALKQLLSKPLKPLTAQALVAISGLLLVAGGVAFYSPPAGLIVLGLGLLAEAYVIR